MPFPDAATVHLCTILSSLSFGTMFLALWSIRGRQTFYLLCGGAALTYAATLGGLMVSGGGIAVSTILCVGLGGYNSYMLAAVRDFEGERRIDGWVVGMPLASGGAFCIVALITRDVAAARIVNSVVLGISTLATGLILLRPGRTGAPRSRRIVGLIQFGYLPCYVASVLLDLAIPIRADWLALMPLLSDQLLLGVLNIALLAMPGERAEAALRETALRDPLTGAFNRAGLAHVERSLILPASVILLDIDHFKQINDRHGHAAGDAVLVAMARGTAAALPAGAHLVRLGGDEFAAVLPGTDDMVAARRLAERLRGITLPYPRCTISLGLACTRPGDDGLTDTLARADAMLYRAKGAGRDCLAA